MTTFEMGKPSALKQATEEQVEHERQQLQSLPTRLYQARAQLEASQDSRMPAPRFGTPERAEYDNGRRQASERGRPITSKNEFQATLRNEIRSIENEIH